MWIYKEIARQMAKGGVKIIHGNIMNVSPDMEWTKWLSYEPEFEKKRIKYLHSKKVADLSYEELKEIMRYRKNKNFARLFKIYGTSECSEEDYLKVYDFMCKESIEKLMLSKLTITELRYAREEITRLCEIPKKELSAKVEEEKKQENYMKLSMVDSYILHVISNIDCARNMEETNRMIAAQIEQNELMLKKSLYNASNPYLKR